MRADGQTVAGRDSCHGNVRMTTRSVKPSQDAGQAPSGPVGPEPLGPVVLKLALVLELTDEQLRDLCSLNGDLRIERNDKGELELLPPADITAGSQNAGINTMLFVWAEGDGRGVAFDSSTGFTLPNGAVRSPDASWVPRSRLAELNDSEKRRFAAICPDFVIELRSNSDALTALAAKMQEYLDNGIKLGWLIDPIRGRVHVYRPDAPVEELERPETMSGEPELPGFSLDMANIWEPDF